MIVIGNLDASTKYYIRVLASTKVGSGVYSESKGKFTNGGKWYLCMLDIYRVYACTVRVTTSN